MIKRITDYLKRPYPVLDMALWKVTLLTCGVVFLIFAFLEPFGINSAMGVYKWFIIAGLMAVTALCEHLPKGLLILFKGVKCWEERNWTVGKNILYNIFILLFIAIGNYLFISILFIPGGFRFSTFLIVTLNTFVIGLFPIILMTMVTENRVLSHNLKEAEGMNRQICQKTAPQVECVPQKVLLQGVTKEMLELEVDKLLLAEACGNYVKIVFIDGEKCRQKMLRVTMKQVEDVFETYPSVQKCHRAFLVNLQYIDTIKGNSQGYRLMMKGWEEEIPVSRVYNKEIKEKVERIYRQ